MNIAEILRKADALSGKAEREQVVKVGKESGRYAGLYQCFKNVERCNAAGKRSCCFGRL